MLLRGSNNLTLFKNAKFKLKSKNKRRAKNMRKDKPRNAEIILNSLKEKCN